MRSNEKYDIYCVGFKRVYYPGSVPGDSSFDEEPATCEKDILCCYIDDYSHSKFEIELETVYGWCGSGYCTSTWGYMREYWVDDFGPLTHTPKDHKPIKIDGAYYERVYGENSVNADWFFSNTRSEDLWYDYEIDNNVFYYDADGDDNYYPRGGAGVNEELFEELPRAFKNRPVWIFSGESATGKSTLAHLLADKRVYETDSAEDGVLPDELWYDVVVIGNKWPDITVDDICARIEKPAEIIIVDFNRKEK